MYVAVALIAVTGGAVSLAGGAGAIGEWLLTPGPGGEPAGPGITGAGVSAGGGRFWIDARAEHLDQGGFTYRLPGDVLVVRCKSFESYNPIMYIQAGDPAAHVTATCSARDADGTRPVHFDGTFFDHDPSGVGDHADLSFTAGSDGEQQPGLADSGPIRRGNITVR